MLHTCTFKFFIWIKR